ncbi:MAG: phosphotransferase [Candidatus Nealsonbacteria bacterium]|nr:phosphotransferase [Candidatus Nealsonbacteria bacterium]
MFSKDLKEYLLEKYDFSDIERVERLRGLESLNYLIKTDRATFVLKVKQGADQVLDKVQKIIRLNDFLKSNHIKVPDILKTKGGMSFSVYGDLVLIVYEFIEGRTLHQSNFDEKSFDSVASLALRVHDLGEKCDLDLAHSLERLPSKEAVAFDFLKKKKDSGIYNLVNELVEVKQRLAENVLVKDFKLLFSDVSDLVHGDFHNENLIFSDEIVLLDLEEMHFGHRMEDLVSFILYACCNTGFEEKNLKNAKTFLDLYSKKHPLSEEEVRLGFHYSLFKSCDSFFIEKESLKKKDEFLVSLLRRDITKFSYFENNLESFVRYLLGS